MPGCLWSCIAPPSSQHSLTLLPGHPLSTATTSLLPSMRPFPYSQSALQKLCERSTLAERGYTGLAEDTLAQWDPLTAGHTL